MIKYFFWITVAIIYITGMLTALVVIDYNVKHTDISYLDDSNEIAELKNSEEEPLIPDIIEPLSCPDDIYEFPKGEKLLDIQERILSVIKEKNFTQSTLLFKIVKCESDFRYCVNNDVGEDSYGLFQINIREGANTDVTKEQANDIEWATNWAIDKINANQQHKEWVNCMYKIDNELL